jgi:ribonuclease HII
LVWWSMLTHPFIIVRLRHHASVCSILCTMITVGIDEVGRGCWAGPLVAGAVILQQPIKGLKDSKKLSKLQREKLTVDIKLEAIAIGLGWVTPQEIDSIGLTEAVRLAMQRAVDQIAVAYDEIIIDGSYNFLAHDRRAQAIIKADDSVPSVSAASIVAKVARDQYMADDMHELYPQYHFDKHVGYGTRLHIETLAKFGPSHIHRLSYKPVALARATMRP